MATCAKCGRNAKRLDGRRARTDEGQPCFKRVTDCKRCGVRGQTLLDDGPTGKGYVAQREKNRFGESVGGQEQHAVGTRG